MKKQGFIAVFMAIVGAPFVVALIKFFKKGPDEPATMQDILAIFGVQVLIAVLICLYLVFFHHATAVLG